MRKYFILLFLFFSYFNTVLAQYYKNQVFNEISKKTVSYSETEEERLLMDIYKPVKDERAKRPALLFVHGGGFAGGARDEPEIIEFCRNMASRGLVAISMSYTLTMKGQSFSCDQAAANKMATFKHAGLEIAAAAKYLIQNKEEYGIDPSLIVLAGSSAGAEAVLHAAFWPETQSPLPHDFQYAGVISMAGAIFDLDLINPETVIPMQLFHGTCDDAVPYGSASHHYCNLKDIGYLMMHGSGSIVEKLASLKKGYYLVTGCNDNHSWAGKPFKYYQDEIADFLMNDVVLKKFRQQHEIIRSNRNCKLEDTIEICAEYQK